MYFKARMSNHPEKWGNYLALGRVEVCVRVCTCVFLTGQKGGSFFNNVYLQCDTLLAQAILSIKGQLN